MKVTTRAPVGQMSGQVMGRRAGWHVRTIRKTGVMYIARNGNTRPNPPTPAQLENQERFAERWGRRKRGEMRKNDNRDNIPPHNAFGGPCGELILRDLINN